MCLHYYHVDAYDETAEQLDTIDLTRTTGNDVREKIKKKIICIFFKI
jgi:hypothetical protein